MNTPRPKQKPPSHLTVVQAARFVGVSHSAVSQRITSGKLPWREIEGIVMVATSDCRRWMRARMKETHRLLDAMRENQNESAGVYRADE